MNWLKKLFVNESTNTFKYKNKELTSKKSKNEQGEGYQDAFSISSISSFNSFYNNHINQQLKTNIEVIENYRRMAIMPEISDVVDDCVIESTQENLEGQIFTLNIKDEKILKNETVMKVIKQEFEELFFNRLDINRHIQEYFRSYIIEGRLYYERIINTARHKDGIQNIKKLPATTMDYYHDYKTGLIIGFIQYLKDNMSKPKTFEEAEKDKNIITFNREQIGFIPYRFGVNKNQVLGYLENCKIAYNQLKLLETSVIVYRMVRAPERFVFKIDVGNMPRQKALAYVQKIKDNMNRKQTYNPETGLTEGTLSVNSIMDNIFIPQSDNRGSDIDTIGGNSSGFTELDDINYFAKKLYRSLKYPMSRVENIQNGSSSENLFRGNGFSEITRDEVKWAKFLESHQFNFCREFVDLFLLHMEFKGLKKQYGLTSKSLHIKMTPPSNYKEQMDQNLLESKFQNYTTLSNDEEWSKTYLMKKYLDLSDEEIQLNSDGFVLDKELLGSEEE